MLVWCKEDKYDVILKVVGFLISPLLGILTSIYRINTRSSFFILFLIYLSFGFALTTPNVEKADFDYDVVRYRSWFEQEALNGNAEFAAELTEWTENFVGHDIFLPVIMFVVSRFTTNYHFLYLVVAFIFAFFFLKSLRYFVSANNYKFSLSCLLLLFVFSLAGGPNHFEWTRWSWANWIAMFSLFKIFVDGRHWYILLLLFTCIVHGSFVVMIPILVLVLFVRRFHKYVPVLLILSLLLSKFFLKVAVWFVPIIFGDKFGKYIDSEYIFQFNYGGTGLMWLERLLNFCLLLLNTVVVLLFSKHFDDKIKSTKYERLYYVLVSLTLFVNFTIDIPDVGKRFILMVYPLLAYIFLSCFYEQRFRNVIYGYAGFILLCLLTFNRFYLLPCLPDYLHLWEPEFYFVSPIYSFVKYLVLY